MLTLIISMLMSLGLVDSAESYNTLSLAEQETLTEIVIVDIETD